MARLYLFAEGQTEQTFANTVLKPHLALHEVYLQHVILIAHSRNKGRVHRGGGRKFQPMDKDIGIRRKEHPGSDVFFTTMIDLYALPKDFPSHDDAENLQNDPYKHVAFLEAAWSESTDDTRFIPYIQLHEYEAILFADVDKLAFFYDNSEKKIRVLQQMVTGVRSPELIDDGPQTAPSKRIIAQFPEYKDAKTTVGPQAAQRIGLAEIRSKCPHFHGWIERLEKLPSQ